MIELLTLMFSGLFVGIATSKAAQRSFNKLIGEV